MINEMKNLVFVKCGTAHWSKDFGTNIEGLATIKYVLMKVVRASTYMQSGHFTPWIFLCYYNWVGGDSNSFSADHLALHIHMAIGCTFLCFFLKQKASQVKMYAVDTVFAFIAHSI